MSVRLRLTRTGRMHRPFYRIGAYDSRTRRDGACLEYLGFYDPLLTTGQRFKLDKEKAAAWIEKGAIPSETVASFLREMEVPYKHSRTASNKKRATKRKAAQAKASPERKKARVERRKKRAAKAKATSKS